MGMVMHLNYKQLTNSYWPRRSVGASTLYFMKAIKIDVTAQTVTDIVLAPGLESMYSAIGCDCIDRRVLDAKNDLWFDDEGLLQNPQQPKFSFGTYPHLFAGNGLICGYNANGVTIGTTLSAEQIRPFIRFLGTIHVEPKSFVIIPLYDFEL